MAVAWLSVLKMVPWGDVISNAPKIAEGAKKLWNTVAKTPPSAESPAAKVPPALSPEAQAIATLQAQLAAAEAAVSDLHNQMLASSELIKALADQNTQLIKRVEATRLKVLWLSGVTVVLAVVAAAGLVLTLAR